MPQCEAARDIQPVCDLVPMTHESDSGCAASLVEPTCWPSHPVVSIATGIVQWLRQPEHWTDCFFAGVPSQVGPAIVQGPVFDAMHVQGPRPCGAS